MSAPPAEVAAVRAAVRAALGGLAPGSLVMAAVSGGPDSMALAAGLAHVAPRLGVRAGAVVVDHRLQPGSAELAARVAESLRAGGLAPVVVERAVVAGPGGPEAAARRARYAALDAVADRTGADVVLVGHTRDDQAETVLLGLARGSGARSLSGMAVHSGRLRRPLLDLPRSTTVACCEQLGLATWDDPHNDDPAYLRVRARRRVLPVMEAELGPGVGAALARTASLLRDDDEALEGWAERLLAEAQVGGLPEAGLDVSVLSAAPAAVRRRVLRRVAVASGVPGSALTAGHLLQVDALVAAWRGQGPVDLPGGVRGMRRCGRLFLARHDPADQPPADQDSQREE